MNMKKLWAGVLSASVVLSTVTFTVLADDTPDMSGTIINVTAANAQDVLDGRYGEITGKTINFTQNITEMLDLARPTAYAASGTKYYQKVGSDETEKAWSESISEDLRVLTTGTLHYYRTLENVTFTANEGVTIEGFHYSSGHVYATGDHDYVRNIDLGNGKPSYYKHSSLKKITFEGLTFARNFDAALYMEGCTVEGITFDGCTFNGNDGYKTNVVAIHMGADNRYFANTTVKNCNINGYFQGVYIRGVDGAVITGNKISDTKHNMIALQCYTNDLKGTVAVEENYLSDGSDRAIRLNRVSESGNVTINNNIMVNCGDSDGQLIKAEACADGSSINLESNYWDGKDTATAVAGLTAPAKTGITGGTWNGIGEETLKGYAAADTILTKNADGTVTVSEKTVAKIGDAEYATLADALAAVKKDDTVELLDDITLTGAAKLSDAGLQGFTLDGKGHTISYKFGNGDHTSSDFIGTTAISFGNDGARKYIAGDITVKDLKMVGEGRFGFFLCGGSKNILFENVEISGNYYYYPINCYGTSGATFKNCTVTNSYDNGTTNEWGASVWSNVSNATHITVIDSKITAIAINKYTTANPLVPKITVKGNSETEIRTYDDGAVSGTRLMCLDAGSDVLVSVKAVEENALTEIKPVAKIGNVLYESLKDAMKAACNMNVQNVEGIPTQTASVTVDLVADIKNQEGFYVRGGATMSTYGSHYVHNIDVTLNGNGHEIDTGVFGTVTTEGGNNSPMIVLASVNGKFTVKNVVVPNDLIFDVSKTCDDVLSKCNQSESGQAESLTVEGCTFYGSGCAYAGNVRSITYRNNKFLLKSNEHNGADSYPLWYKFNRAIESFTFEGNTVEAQRALNLGRFAANSNIVVKDNKFTVANTENAAKGAAIMLAENHEASTAFTGNVIFSGNTVDADSAVLVYAPSEYNTNFNLTAENNTLLNGTKLLGYNSWSGSYNDDPAKVADAEEKLENLLKQTAAETVELAFEKVSDSVYNIVVRGKGGRYINRLTAVDLTFAIDNSDIAYAISPADKVTLTEENGRYLFNFDGVNAADASGSGIVIGKVEFTGFGRFEFNATAGVANTTKFADNIVDTFVSDAATEEGRFDITNADASINTTLAPATHKLTINITFPNAIADQKAAYQDMKVVISGGDLPENLAYDLGSDRNTLNANGAYVLEVADTLTENTAYTVTVSGAGYRTARYTVTMTADKTLNFWNNVKDTPAVVEEGSSTGAKSVTFLAGDIVKDGKINIYDLSAVVSYFGEDNLVSAHPEYAKYDLNRDGKIDSKDVAYVLVSWGK